MVIREMHDDRCTLKVTQARQALISGLAITYISRRVENGLKNRVKAKGVPWLDRTPCF